MSDYDCQCPLVGYCQRHDTIKQKREWELCQGIRCSPKIQKQYKTYWDMRVGLIEAPQHIVRTGGLLAPRGQQPLWIGHKLCGVPIDRDKLFQHIAFHVMPLAGDCEWVWRKHVAWLREVRPQFNGRLIVGVVTAGPNDPYKFCPKDAVIEAFDGMDAEIFFVENDASERRKKGRGEGLTFSKMLDLLVTKDPNEVIVYGHTKGVTHGALPPEAPPHLWAEAMFDIVLRNQSDMLDALDAHGCAGPFMMSGPFTHFSGTFFGLRAVEVFSRSYKHVGLHYGCVERWPAQIFNFKKEAKCLFANEPGSLYEMDLWQSSMSGRVSRWRLGNAYQHAASHPTDFVEHVPVLKQLVSECESVLEFGMRYGVSSTAILAAQPKRFTSVDLVCLPETVRRLERIRCSTELKIVEADSRTYQSEPVDLVFIDTHHIADVLKIELAQHAPNARRYIVLHDVVTFGEWADGVPGLMPAVRDFLADNSEWRMVEFHENCHGLAVMQRDR
jgi:predicted O-methyltransferase YrrM